MKILNRILFLLFAILAIKTKETAKIIPFIVLPLAIYYWPRTKHYVWMCIVLFILIIPIGTLKTDEQTGLSMKIKGENLIYVLKETADFLIPDFMVFDRIYGKFTKFQTRG